VRKQQFRVAEDSSKRAIDLVPENLRHVIRHIRPRRSSGRRRPLCPTQAPLHQTRGQRYEFTAARHEFLSRAALTQNQHRIWILTHSSDPAVHALHLQRNTGQIREPRPRPPRLAQHAVFLVHVQQTNQAIQLAAQFGDVKRFGDVIRGPQTRRLHRAFNRAVLRQHQHGRLRIGAAHALPQFQPADLRQAQVRDQNIHRHLIQDFQRLLRRRGCARA
jgi:hypothetical protein